MVRDCPCAEAGTRHRTSGFNSSVLRSPRNWDRMVEREDLLALAGIRKAMECIFSLHDLSWLDDILPEKIVTVEEPKTEDTDSTDSEDTELKYQEKAPEINISVN
ncbi:unnamed protein product [Ranitomeya imitator]|uniref:Uncharacterized protein n=1 Tax=Ranitomeya imitator TaxID=111125 RepID=A0ABN9MDL6_9NEOB|nr:unnamed protein product [Ranitomeya imitator]